MVHLKPSLILLVSLLVITFSSSQVEPSSGFVTRSQFIEPVKKIGQKVIHVLRGDEVSRSPGIKRLIKRLSASVIKEPSRTSKLLNFLKPCNLNWFKNVFLNIVPSATTTTTRTFLPQPSSWLISHWHKLSSYINSVPRSVRAWFVSRVTTDLLPGIKRVGEAVKKVFRDLVKNSVDYSSPSSFRLEEDMRKELAELESVLRAMLNDIGSAVEELKARQEALIKYYFEEDYETNKNDKKWRSN